MLHPNRYKIEVTENFYKTRDWLKTFKTKIISIDTKQFLREHVLVEFTYDVIHNDHINNYSSWAEWMFVNGEYKERIAKQWQVVAKLVRR